jgi:hypothetical protein
MAKGWMSGAVRHPGGLHRALGVPMGQKIPAARVAEAKNSKNPRIRRMATLAQTFAKARH